MTPLMWGAAALVIFIVAALAIRSSQSPLAQAAHLFASAEPIRMRSQFDVETDEDLAVITDVYRDQRKAERARQALERLAPLVPSAKASK
jgi:hypothetical protein